MPEPVTKPYDLHELAAASRAGDLTACARLTERIQTELLRVAYLLTGEQAGALELAGESLTTAMCALVAGGSDERFRNELYRVLSQIYLYPSQRGRGNASSLRESGSACRDEALPHPPQAPIAGAQPVFPVNTPQHYQVDDERTRTLAALRLLDSAERLALVLLDAAGLPPETAASMTGQPRAELIERLAVVRRRLVEVVGLRTAADIRPALAGAALEAPREALWPRIEGFIVQSRRRAQRRAHVITAGAVAAVLLLLLGLAALLPRQSGDDSKASATATMPPQAARSGTPAVRSATNLPTPPPTPPLTSAGLLGGASAGPPADIPSLLLADTGGQLEMIENLTTGSNPPVTNALPPKISADGEQLFFVRTTREDGRLRTSVVAVRADGFTPQWETELRSLRDLSEGQSWSYAVDLAVTSDRVYIASRAWQLSEPISIVALERAGGAVAGRWTLEFHGPITGLFGLFASPDGSALHLFLLGQWPDSTGVVSYFRFNLPAVGFDEHIHPVGGRMAPEFFFWSARPLPDGSGLYVVDYVDNGRTPSIRIFDFASGRLSDIVLPFNKTRENAPVPVEATASHDGRWLYILAPTRAEVAIVDLAARKLEQTFPLDLGRYAFAGNGWHAPLLPANQALRLSRDGLRLYAVGLPVDGQGDTAGIWVIDTAVWRVIDHWLPERPIWSLILDGDRLYALETSYSRTNQLEEPRRLHLLDALSGLPLLPDQRYADLWSTPMSMETLYQQQHGRSPAVEAVPPLDPMHDFGSLPAIQVVLIEPQEPDGSTQVEVRFVHPASGAPLTVADPTIRYTPPLDLALSFSSNDRAGPLVIPGLLSDGVYRADVPLGEGVTWDLEVTLTDSAGFRRRLWFPAFVTLTPAGNEATQAPSG